MEQKRAHMSKDIMGYHLIVFDLDGTLYHQRALRIKMAGRLLSHYLFHLNQIKELWILYQFRKVRDRWDEIERSLSKASVAAKTESLEIRQYRYVAKLVHTSEEKVRHVIETWIYKEPLSLLNSCKDTILSELIDRLHASHIHTAVYSDYPVEEKLKALNITTERMFSALDQDIMALKPDPKGLRFIMSSMGFGNQDILMVGDRYSKDGMAAIHADVDYLILDKNQRKRNKQYQDLGL
ncbi:MAG: HAD family hydrolase [Clostridia bacterium]|nr:HAD family hydrolase [Clostridia bacterium]